MKRFRHSSFSETQKQPASVLSKVPPGINSQSTEPSLAASGGRPPAAAPGHGRATSAPQPPRQTSNPAGGRPAAPALHDMGRIVTLFNPVPPAEKKFMCAGYLWKRVELQPDGKAPNPSHPDARWTKWYVQLTGAELSLWSVEKMEEAVKENRTVGPTFLKLTEAFVSAVDTQTIPHAGKPPPHCPWVFSLNNAASNRILFAPEEDRQTGQSTLDALKMWINCIRLAEWEMSMLNNIFTGTLLGLRGEAAQQSPLVKGRLEDWVQVRVPGDSDWYRAYLVVTDGQSPAKSKRRLSSFMSLSSSQSSGLSDHAHQGPSACFYASKRSKKPFLTYTQVRVAQAVFPEAEQLIPSTAVAKVEGLLEWDSSEHTDVPDGLKLSEKEKSSKLASSKGEPHAICLIMPDGEAAQADRQAAMLSWILAFADSFGLFGRKAPRYNIAWVPQNPESPYFAYPVGPTRDRLYFDVPLIVHMEPWQSEPSSIHKSFHDMLQKRMDPNARKTSGPSVLPQAPGEDRRLQQQQQQQQARSPLGARPSQGALQEESEPQEETLARPQQSTAPPQLAPLSGSGSMDMDNFFARAPVTPRMDDSPQLATQARASPPSTANTLQPSDRQAVSERPKLPALQTSDSALHSNNRAAVAPPSQRVETGAMHDPRPVAMATGSNRFLEEKDLRRGPTPKMDARSSPQPGAQHSRGPSAAMSNQREDSLPLPVYPEQGASAATRDEPQKKHSSEPSSAYTLPSEYSQRSSPAPPLPEVQPLFKSQQQMSSAPGSLGLMYSGSPQQPSSSPVGPPDEPLPQPPPQTSAGVPQETPFQPPPIGNGHVTATPEPEPEPSPALALPGALPASSQHASIYGSSRAPSDRGLQVPEQQQQQSETGNATAGATGALAHGPQPRGASSADTAKADLPETQPAEDTVQNLQRQASSSQGHSGIDDYASLALSYMNLAPAEQPHQQQQQQEGGSTRSQPSQAPSTAHTSTAAIERPRSTSPDPYGQSGVSPTGADMRMPEIKIGGGSKQSSQQQGPQPSTFARSKGDDRAQASQRQKEGQGKAHHKPGRSVGSMLKSRSKLGGGAWDSDDEEDQDEEEEEEEDDNRRQGKSEAQQQQSPGRPPRMSMPPQHMASQGPTHAQSPSLSPMREQPSQGGTSPGAQANQLGVAPGRHSMYGPQPERRSSRTLPVPPGQTQPIERSASNQGLADHPRPPSNPNAATQYRQPLPRSPSAMHRMQQLQQSEGGGDERPLSQYSTAGPMPQGNNRPMSFMMQNYPEAAAEFQQQQPQSYQGNTPSPPIATSRGGPLTSSGEPHKTDLSGVAGFSTEGMLQAGLKSRHDHSAKQREALARESGAPLVDIGTSERQREMYGSSGMVGAMAERERAKSRDGSGTASALRKQHEQQQQQQQQQMPMSMPMQPYGHGHSPSQASGFFPPPQQQQQQSQQSQFMNPMFNPYMMGMGGMGGMSPGGMNPFMLQQQAMMAAQQAYMNTMMSSSMGSTMSGPTSPQMGGGPSPSGSPAPGGHSPHMSMYGAPPGWGNPYMMNSMNMGGMGGFPGAPSPVPDWGSSHGHGNNGLNQSQRSMANSAAEPSPPLDESSARRNVSQ